VDFQPDRVESSPARALRIWRDIGLAWKGAAIVLGLGLLLWNQGMFAVPFRIGTLERDVSGLKVDVSTLRSDVNTLRIDMAEVKTDVAAIKEGLEGFKGEVLAEIRAGVAEMKLAAGQKPVPVAIAAAPPKPQAPVRAAKRARVAKKEPAPSSWMPLWKTQ
jgi:hypothetical protein